MILLDDIQFGIIKNQFPQLGRSNLVVVYFGSLSTFMCVLCPSVMCK